MSCQTKVIVRRAQPSDKEQMVSVMNWAYRDRKETKGWTGEGHLIEGDRITWEQLNSQLETTKTSVFLVAVHESEPALVGVVKVELVPADSDGDPISVDIGNLSVDPDHQSQGIGGQLLRAAERCALDEFGASVARMHVISIRSDIIGWYTRQGYRKVDGVVEPFPDAIVGVGMPKVDGSLEFQLFEKKL
jgi:ribosomal protein S18 acetylase RimI-like enzyme